MCQMRNRLVILIGIYRIGDVGAIGDGAIDASRACGSIAAPFVDCAIHWYPFGGQK